MNTHLSDEQFAKCFTGVATNPERRHLSECSECRAELRRFGETLTSLRGAVRRHVEDHVQALAGNPIAVRPVSAGNPAMRWALMTATVLLLGVIPWVLLERPQPVAESAPETPDALMDAINLHLSRTVPSPMEPMMSLIERDVFITDSGGMQ
jgi:predicted anti-sigma-YlaC factor YlaD